MLTMESVDTANEIYCALIEKGALKDSDSLVSKYKDKDNEAVRQIIKNRCKKEGTDVLLGKDYLHLISTENSVYCTSFSELRDKYYSIESKKYLHLIGLIHLTFFSEANNEMTSLQLNWLHNGISYYKLIDQVDRVISQLYEKQVQSNGDFSKEFSIAIDDVYHLWKRKDTDKPNRQRIAPSNKTKFGLVHTAMKILEDDNLVFIKVVKTSAQAIPTPLLHERLDLQFNNNVNFQEIKQLINETKNG
ncbi:hypothetical protein HMPREF1013_03113 [Bacillus sp. 2_A_57_CT2]|nr:hypothetical protein HMPREF1013_03113 [Bacillus sp. 2_A_57_CT2]